MRLNKRVIFVSNLFMRRFLLLFLVFHFATGNVVGEELMKLPFLVKHLQLHQQRNPGDGIFDFLRLHYTNTRHRQADPAHQNLPLKTLGLHAQTSMLTPPAGGYALALATASEQKTLLVHNDTLLPADFRARLLRPPRS